MLAKTKQRLVYYDIQVEYTKFAYIQEATEMIDWGSEQWLVTLLGRSAGKHHEIVKTMQQQHSEQIQKWGIW